ncbi:MAG: NADH-quinone oxidoreductase subunit L [Pyrinomonadaceae bacterium]
MTENNFLSLIIFAPLFGAIANWVYGGWFKQRNETVSGTIACAAIGVSTVVAFMIAFGIGTPHKGALFMDEGKPILDQIWTWVQVGGFRADFGLGMDRLSGIYALFVTFVGLLIHVFATGYMHKDPGFYRFFAYLNLFMFSMLTLVLADNFLLMFVGWEGVGLCSYLLIGYYIKRDEARKAAKKAFVMNRIGDWGVLMGMFLIFTITGSISFFDKSVDGVQVQSVFSWIQANVMTVDPFTWGAIFAGGLTSVGVLLFIGATGKSAQIPLFVWLPDAMAGPTPVSALIHAATMVTAGVYMVVRCNVIYQHAPTALFIIAIIGAATAMVAATIGLAQNDIKKVLAYSTVSQLGYMFLACGVGAFVAAIFHVMTHAFFKALLFLGSGSVIHGMHHEQDMRLMGNLKKYMPVTFLTMAAGWLAICGIVPFAGFFSKDEILYKTFAAEGIGGWAVFLWIIGVITAIMTAVYMTRLMVMTFWGRERFGSEHAEDEAEDHHPADEHLPESDDEDDDEEHHHLPPDFKPHESPWVMTVPLIVLAFLSVVGGLVGIPHAMSNLVGAGDVNVFEHTLEPVTKKIVVHKAAGETKEVKHFFAEEGGTEEAGHENTSTELGLAVLSVALAVLGIAIGWFGFKENPLRRLPKVLENKWYVDEFYNKYIVDPITNLSREGLWKGFDLGVIDGIVNGLGHFVVAMGSLARSIQVGFVRSYAAFMLFGALLVIGYFIYYGFQLIK